MSTTQPTDTDHDLVEQFETFLDSYAQDALVAVADGSADAVELSWRDLHQHNPDLAHDYRTQPETVRRHAEAAARNALADLPADVTNANPRVRVHDMGAEQVTGVGAFSPSEHRGEALPIDGQVAKVSAVKPEPQVYAFECVRCDSMQTIPQPDGAETHQPHECEGCDRQGPFDIVAEQSDYRDHQLWRIQEPPEQLAHDRGETIDVHVRDDLCDAVQPGDRVIVNGILKFDDDLDDGLPDPYLSAESVDVRETDYEDIDISSDDRERIEAIANGEEGEPLDALAESITPAVHASEAPIARALALQLVGGDDGDTLGEPRGSIHVLLMGDPGTAKSTRLDAVADLAPRSVRTSGKNASTAGMVAAAVRDDFGDSEWGLEAGALVTAHKGIAAIDEIDKVDPEAVEAMHQAMSRQRADISKAGIKATLPAASAVLAAGNPTHGRFEPTEALPQQIDLAPTLLSRFDLIFLLEDRPEQERDTAIGETMTRAREERKRSAHRTSTDTDDVTTGPVDAEMLRKYVAYARRECHPTITDDSVRETMVEQFASLRAMGEDADTPVPVTPRKLDAVHRIAEAAARARLSDTIDEQDVETATNIVGASMQQVGRDPETGQLDADIVNTGQSKSQRDRLQLVHETIANLQREVDGAGEGVPMDAITETLTEQGSHDDASSVKRDVEKLTQSGELYQPSTGQYRAMGTYSGGGA